MVEKISLYNQTRQQSLDINQTTSQYFILDKVDWGVITASHHEYKYQNQYGVTVVGTSIGTRDISIEGWVIADSFKTDNTNALTQRKAILNAFFNPLHMITLYYSDYAIDFIPQNTIKYGTEREENNDVIVHWVVDGIAPDPYFRKVADSRIKAQYVKGQFHFPLTILNNNESLIFGTIEQEKIFNVSNGGHIPTGIVITFFARGEVVNPKLIDIDSQEFMYIRKTMSTGEKIVIDTNRGNRTVYGYDTSGNRYNYFKYKTLDSSWLTMDVGSNFMNYTADSGEDLLDVYIDLNFRYQEVQECY